ncbi:MAG: class A beta-lactamase-related serine hydrolase [Planctomycetota bacterium]|nr:MAG: class A beta-lactamase-related serine hydrolase [Planctomycetota bacterium]
MIAGPRPTMLALLPLLLAAPLPAPQEPPPKLVRACREELERIVAERGIPGATLGVVLPDGRSFGVAAGFADPATEARMTPDARMLAGSIGKTFFAAWILRRAEEGKVDLDAPLRRYLGDRPWFERLPNAEGLTLRLLLGHRSGIPEHVQAPGFLAAVLAEPDKVWAPGERLAWILDRAPLFAPGEGWSYADTNFIVAALAVEAATGEEAYAAIRREFLQPLGLDGIAPSDRRELPGLVPGFPRLLRLEGMPERTLDDDGRFFCNPQMEWAGGGFLCTARDLARWGHALLAGELLRPETRAAMRDGVPATTGPGDRYGLGLQLWDAGGELGPAEGHGGWFPGYLSELAHFPRLGFTLALQVDTDDLRRVGPLREHLRAIAERLRVPYTPTAGYERRELRGWTVRVHRGLLEGRPELAARVLDELDCQLHLVERAVPRAALAELRRVEIWVEDGGRQDGGMCFHPSEAWLRANGYNPDKTSTVEISSPENFLAWVGHQQWMVLHELAHAWHFRVVDGRPERAAAVRAAWERARDSGAYDQVLVFDGRHGRHYALENEREYFAELSEAWFGANDFYPFVRAELLECDPEGAAAVAAAWGDGKQE